MIDYGQFCTVARGAEVLGELWTPLVVRELLCGSRRFNEIRRGVPRMSATLLTQRLRKLETLGVVERRRVDSAWEYHLTPAGEELRPLVVGLGHWGARWIGSRLKPKQLDAGFLMWDIRRFAQLDKFPAGQRIVIHFQFTDAPRGERVWWLVVENGTADLCRDDPGHEVSVVLFIDAEDAVAFNLEVFVDEEAPPRVAETCEVRAGSFEFRVPSGRVVLGATRVGAESRP